MGLDFLRQYRGNRLEQEQNQPPLVGELASEKTGDGEDEMCELDLEMKRAQWTGLSPDIPDKWRAKEWSEGPVRFIDGKDVGQTVAWLRAPGGYPVPVRLSQIGGVTMELDGSICLRKWAEVERIVSMVVDPFPWHEVESFAIALAQRGFRLLPAKPPGGHPSHDFEVMRKAAQNRSNDEMGIWEELALASNITPAVVDGRLEPRTGGFQPTTTPVYGVIKTHQKTYLHARGMELLYQLQAGQRTPFFGITKAALPVISWYIRLAGGPRVSPNCGLIRVEVAKAWFDKQKLDRPFVDRLTHTLYEYRCREKSYGRAPVTLHPIVRAEESLGALFASPRTLNHRFYCITGL